MAFARVILRLPNAEGPRVSPMRPPNGKWPPSSKCGGTAPGVVEMRLDSASSIIMVIESLSVPLNCGITDFPRAHAAGREALDAQESNSVQL
jgi:hypothetical protein